MSSPRLVVSPPSPRHRHHDEAWVEAFRRGDRDLLARCYEDYLATVNWAVGGVLQGVDRETVVHDVFCRLFGNAEVRGNFEGGNFGAWIITVARRQAIDFRRRLNREAPITEADIEQAHAEGPTELAPDDTAELRLLVERFRKVLPPKWEPVFRVRFLEQIEQREAARQLNMSRSTLAYQEIRIRALLRAFVLGENK